jgi:hypothetical protein
MKKMKKYLKMINDWLSEVTNLLQNVLAFAVVCGLLFNDPFGIISTISNLLNSIGEKGTAGLISLLIIFFVYRR